MMSHDSIMIHRVMMSMSVHPCTSGGRLLMYLSLLRDVFSFIVKFKGDTFALESAANLILGSSVSAFVVPNITYIPNCSVIIG